MALKLAIVVCAVAVASADIKPGGFKEKYQAEESRAVETYAQDALGGVYSECFAQLSFSCLQRKVLNFVHRMGRMEQFNVLGQYLSVVKVRDENETEHEFQARLATAQQEDNMDDLMESVIDRFFNNHVIRIKLPNSLTVRGVNSRSSDSIDLQFPFADEVEARKKGGGGGGGGGKMGKKMMMMMMMGIKAKLMMLGPMMMGLAGLMAMKALIAGVVSLTISKIMIIKKLMKQKGGGGGGHSSGGWESSGGSGGWSSGGGGGGGGGGGWDRRSRDSQDGWDPSELAYRAYSTVENLL